MNLAMNQGNASPSVLVAREGTVLIITINRPAVRNAINRATSEAIALAVDQLDADPTLAIGILTGSGAHFCSGMDLKAFLQGERVELEGRGLAGIVEQPPRKPLIAAVEGYALAGGCEIALACDLIVAADNAQFGIPEVRRGLIAGSGGLLRLQQRIPRQIALEYALTGQAMRATEARQWGLAGFVGRSAVFGKMLAELRSVQGFARTNVLLTGESGTGKELIARALHYGGPLATGPFVPVNCSALPAELAESLLFGHVRGSFTGATADRKGWFELAHGGNLCIGFPAPNTVQVKDVRHCISFFLFSFFGGVVNRKRIHVTAQIVPMQC